MKIKYSLAVATLAALISSPMMHAQQAPTGSQSGQTGTGTQNIDNGKPGDVTPDSTSGKNGRKNRSSKSKNGGSDSSSSSSTSGSSTSTGGNGSTTTSK